MDYLTYRWTNIVYLLYTTYIGVDLAHHEIFLAKVGKGGIRSQKHFQITGSGLKKKNSFKEAALVLRKIIYVWTLYSGFLKGTT